MSRTRSRLRKLEAATSGPRKVRIIWSNTSDEREWDQQIAEMIASGEARATDEFLRVGWLPPGKAEGAGAGAAAGSLKAAKDAVGYPRTALQVKRVQS
jgi:hypothetical protein